MALDNVKVTLNGHTHLSKALNNLADEKGRKWKRQAFRKAGKDAFTPVISAAKAFAPRGKTGLTKNTITTSSRYNFNARKRAGKFASEFTIYTTYGAKFNRRTQRDRRGRPVRYPFMNEVGIPPQTYLRRLRGKTVLTHATRSAPRNALGFQSRALGSTANKAVGIFTSNLDKYIGLYSKREYDSLPQELKRIRK